MSILDELKKLAHPYEDEDEDPGMFDDELQERDMFEDRRPRSDDRRSKVVNIHATTQLKVILVKPERFENASEIADQLKDKRTVVLNLESTNKDVAVRQGSSRGCGVVGLSKGRGRDRYEGEAAQGNEGKDAVVSRQRTVHLTT